MILNFEAVWNNYTQNWKRGFPRGEMAAVLDWYIVVSELKL